ncbi:polygalacturonase-like [Manihot esculenta]|uniref:polygalacturonase-like n=1 Tax=Manihot esculenta TaxID=3983 RepID=UPI001CC3A019|nr:polygalacturonase-like [Manihot esculenta]XP_043808322.1 polygalacturonase-like [Manihot esculenta]XP_043808323.1 polygalacturonase-like [Manihot esculenta]XP_043808324.1 polygalacturonase-like [Manihot esculenta]XP_043808325.1 polygalacturonase-like [Manihot esculenta]XP_043808326.1 polygalacturonase-like [Manihot esculenta]XP_043808327.1 polygalacturonase-like [Manihot esculenta]XP_043808328.1 polygalacturonase-like [Manihot esculenta]XP_043808330.1 polygalacturonase-like [Manihot escu
MGSKVHVCAAYLVLLFAFTSGAQPNTFDVTKYGAKEGSDITKALLSAWKGACGAAGSGKVVIPKGKYSLGVVDLLGPCKGAMHLQVEGTLVAPAKASQHRKNSWVTLRYLDRLTVSGGGAFDGQGEIAWQRESCGGGCKKALPVLRFLCVTVLSKLYQNLRFDFVTNSIVEDVTSIDSKQFHVNLLGSKNLTFQRFSVKAPGHSPNTDGIHIGRSEEINIIDSNIMTGDDCISIGRGSRQVRITNVRCGHGHGISIGSLGKYEKEEPVSGIYVKNCTIYDTDNGVRIKTWPALHGGSVSNIQFEDIVMQNVSNPIIIDQMYCPHNECNRKVTFQFLFFHNKKENLYIWVCYNYAKILRLFADAIKS